MSPPSSARSLVSLITDWKVILAALVSLLVTGMAWGTWNSTLATKSELGGVRQEASIARDRLRTQADSLADRVTRQEEGSRWRDATLKAIADKLGVIVPTPPLTLGAP
jgi:hypothetical protein